MPREVSRRVLGIFCPASRKCAQGCKRDLSTQRWGSLAARLWLRPRSTQEASRQPGLQQPPHPWLQELCQSALANLEEPEPRCRPLVCAKSKPEPLKLFTPRLVKVWVSGWWGVWAGRGTWAS